MRTSVHPNLEQSFPELPQDFLKILKMAGQKEGISRIAIVGGVIRDYLIKNIHNEKLPKHKDLDLLVEGEAEQLAQAICIYLGQEKVQISRENKPYKTVELKINGVSIDLASARKETYPAPGENPQIFNALLEDDLSRRDFTANAIALDLTNNALIDLYKGRHGIKSKKLEFLHSRSVIDDPTRIVRGARYSARFGFKLSPQSLKQIESAIKLWPWNWKQGDPTNLAPPALGTRLRRELELLFNEDNWLKGLRNLQKWGAFSLLDSELQGDSRWERRLLWASRLGVNPLTALIAGTSNPCSLALRLQIPNNEQNLLVERIKFEKFLISLSSSKEYINWKPSQWCNAIESAHWQPELIALAICSGVTQWRQLLRWWGKWRLIKSPTSAKELLSKGWEQGPKLGEELKRLRAIKLDEIKKLE